MAVTIMAVTIKHTGRLGNYIQRASGPLLQWNLCIVVAFVTVEPLYCGRPWANILWLHYRGWLVHNTLATCTLGEVHNTLGPNKVALLERLAAIE